MTDIERIFKIKQLMEERESDTHITWTSVLRMCTLCEECRKFTERYHMMRSPSTNKEIQCTICGTIDNTVFPYMLEK